MTSLFQLVMPFLMQPSIVLPFFAAAAAHFLLILILSTRTPKSLSTELLPRWVNPSLSCTVFPGARPYSVLQKVLVSTFFHLIQVFLQYPNLLYSDLLKYILKEVSPICLGTEVHAGSTAWLLSELQQPLSS